MSQITKTIQHMTGGEIEHPDGLRVRVPPRAFRQNSVVKVSRVTPSLPDSTGMGTANLGTAFQVSCSNSPSEPLQVVFAIKADAARRIEAETAHTFVEVRQGCESTLVSAPLKKRTQNGRTEHIIETTVEWPHQADVVLAPGYLASAAPSSYIPMPHQVKIFPLDLDEHGSCRRAGGADCSDPKPQTIYPACYPAAWAKLYSAYRLVLPPVKRRLEVGTPHGSRTRHLMRTGTIFPPGLWAPHPSALPHRPFVSRIGIPVSRSRFVNCGSGLQRTFLLRNL